ncbi:MAG TPA: alpha-E domain-containing protein [Burkholderiaceae bacterium]|nr:alpha-E domain-containing protein [Burkholderiaceae bacterium]
MLSRTADHLFWMARYTERAENTARMLDVNVQTALLPQSISSAELLWRGMLGISELQPQFEAHYDKLTPQNVLRFMVTDPSTPSSIYSCLQGARENARAVRGTLTTEVWETINATWLELRKKLKDKLLERDPSQFFEWVKYRSHLSRGVMIGTMLKDEGFYFARLGTFLERADNAARILDVKYHALAQQGLLDSDVEGGAEVGQRLDFYHWAAILRSVSAFEIYRKVYSDVITPARVAELLILRGDMPRSLMNCMNEVVDNLAHVRNRHSAETERRAGLLQADLHYGRIDDILRTGLHTYLTNFLERVNDLGNRISRDFLVPLIAA